MAAVGGALVLALLLVVGFVAVAVVGFGTFFLLSTSVLPFVDANSYGDILV